MTNKAAGAAAAVDVPQTKGGVPRAGKGKLSIGRDHNIGYEVVVSTKSSTSESVVALFSGEGPHNDCLLRLILKDGDITKPLHVTLSLEAERIIVGSSEVVAMEVTQPLCPVKTPRRVSCSPIVVKGSCRCIAIAGYLEVDCP